MNSPDFRELLDKWDNHLLSERKDKVKALLDNDLIFFFTRNGEHFGCPEEGRMVFAKLKAPDEEETKGWENEAAFLAYNLSQALKADETPKRLFYKKDMGDLKVIDKDVLTKLLGI